MPISAESVRFKDDAMWVTFADGRVIGVPLALLPHLLHASPEEREAVEIRPFGLRWDALDEDISFTDLIGRLARDHGGSEGEVNADLLDDHLSENDRFLYSSAQQRISDLNRTVFQTRVLFLSLVAGFFTAVSFIVSSSTFASNVATADFYAVLFLILAFLAVVFSTVLFLFELIFQEFIDQAVEALRNFEARLARKGAARIFSSGNSARASFRINSLVCLFYIFYVLPAFFLLSYAASVVRSDSPFDRFLGFIRPRCVEFEMMAGIGGSTVDAAVTHCINQFREFEFAFSTVVFAGVFQSLALVVLLYFCIFAGQRVAGKYAVVLDIPKLKEAIDSWAPKVAFVNTILSFFFLLGVLSYFILRV